MISKYIPQKIFWVSHSEKERMGTRNRNKESKEERKEVKISTYNFTWTCASITTIVIIPATINALPTITQLAIN